MFECLLDMQDAYRYIIYTLITFAIIHIIAVPISDSLISLRNWLYHRWCRLPSSDSIFVVFALQWKTYALQFLFQSVTHDAKYHRCIVKSLKSQCSHRVLCIATRVYSDLHIWLLFCVRRKTGTRQYVFAASAEVDHQRQKGWTPAAMGSATVRHIGH